MTNGDAGGGHPRRPGRAHGRYHLRRPGPDFVVGRLGDVAVVVVNLAYPDAATYPSGGNWAEQYLQPPADALGDQVRFGATVTGVSRAGRDRIVDADRDAQPFVVHVARRTAVRSGCSPAR